jgi:hypothetical protein
MFCCVCFIMMLCTSCNCRTVELTHNGPSNNVMKSHDILYYLDVRKPSVTQPIERGGPEGSKFVQVEVTEVLNPKKYPLTFEVRYQSKDNVKTYLGSFSLYPADNPGKFIVATQGKVKDEGAIILSLVVPEKVDPRDTIKVTVKKMKFLKG